MPMLHQIDGLVTPHSVEALTNDAANGIMLRILLLLRLLQCLVLKITSRLLLWHLRRLWAHLVSRVIVIESLWLLLELRLHLMLLELSLL